MGSQPEADPLPAGRGRNLEMPLMLIGLELGQDAKEHFKEIVDQFDDFARCYPGAAPILLKQVLWRTHPELLSRADAALTSA